MSAPAKVTLPPLGLMSPDRARSSVVLPWPFGPKRPTRWPSTAIEMSCSTSTRPYPATSDSTCKRMGRLALSAKIGIDDALVAHHFGGRAFDEFAAEIHHHHPLGDAEEQGQDMFDE